MTASGNVMLVSELHLANALSPMLVIPLCKVTSDKFVQPLNTLFAMLVTPSGITIEVKPLQLANASSSILVNPLGNFTLVNVVRSKNASLPMLVIITSLYLEGRTSEVALPVYFEIS